jgi:putative SOS response-associated peptidase YedK
LIGSEYALALAGLWDRWRSADKSESKETFTIVTTEPIKFAAQFHNRMPLVLEPNTWEGWLREMLTLPRR